MKETALERRFAGMLLTEAEKLPPKWQEVVRSAAHTIERLCDAVEAKTVPSQNPSK